MSSTIKGGDSDQLKKTRLKVRWPFTAYRSFLNSRRIGIGRVCEGQNTGLSVGYRSSLCRSNAASNSLDILLK